MCLIYACELHLEDRPNDTKLIVRDLGVHADNTISSSFFFFFFFLIGPFGLREVGFSFQISMGGGTTWVLSTTNKINVNTF